MVKLGFFKVVFFWGGANISMGVSFFMHFQPSFEVLYNLFLALLENLRCRRNFYLKVAPYKEGDHR